MTTRKKEFNRHNALRNLLFLLMSALSSCQCSDAFVASTPQIISKRSTECSISNYVQSITTTCTSMKTRQSQQQQQHQLCKYGHPSNPASQSTTSSITRLYMWEGDDIRWTSRFWRRFLRRSRDRASSTPIRTTLMATQCFMFIYQIMTTVNFIRQGHPDYWPRYALSMIGDASLGTSVVGPLTRDFAFSCALSHNQPHRFLTSGFVHGGILHLLVNMDTIGRQPSWIETGLGGGLYLTTFILSIVAGNLGHMYAMESPWDRGLVLGSSGGVCGLYGLMYVSLLKMGNGRAATSIARGMLTLFVAGSFFDSISSPSHIGGFLCGVVLGILCGPKSYQKDYSLRRKNSVQYDDAPKDYRQAMGFGNSPSKKRWIPLPLLWGCLATGIIALGGRQFRTMPALVLKGFLFPGSLL